MRNMEEIVKGKSKRVEITVLALTRPFFLLEWEKEHKKLSQIELVHRLYSMQMVEIDKETIKMVEIWINKIRPSVVFLDGALPSEELQVCSPEAAGRYVERDYTDVGHDYRAIMAQMAGAEVVYLDQGFEKVNPDYRMQKRLNEAIFLVDEMIRQVEQTHDYLRYGINDPKTLDNIHVDDPQKYENVRLHKMFRITELFEKRLGSLFVEGKANFPEGFPIEHYFGVEYVLKNQKDLKKLQALQLENKIQEGREDFWEEKSKNRISQLPDGSRVMYIIEAGHVGIQNDGSISPSDCIKKFQLPEGGIVNWGLRYNPHVGNFHEKLSKFGRVNIVDLTQENVKNHLEKGWKIGP